MKQAAVDVTSPIIAEAIRVLVAAGLRITGSLNQGFADGGPDEVVRLLIADDTGNVLPDACGGAGLWLVRITVQVERYGSRQLTRLRPVEPIGLLDPAAMGRAIVVAAAPTARPGEAAQICAGIDDRRAP